MSCYHPILGVSYYGELNKNDKHVYHVGGSFNPEFVKDKEWRAANNVYDVIKIPCGHCIGCALDRSRSWSDRMLLEYVATGRKALFVTLTYSNDYVPIACDEEGVIREFSLCKRDLQLFFKRIRRRFYNNKIRFYASGELGGKTKRPHYHAIIFGLDLSDFPDCIEKGVNELGHKYYISESFARSWPYGYHILAGVSYKTFSYVSRYCMKKIVFSEEPDYGEPEFHLMSRNPGLGKPYYDLHPDLFESQSISLFDGEDVKKINIPSYFYQKLIVDNPDIYDKLNLSQRSVLASDSELLKLQKTNLSYLDYLEVEEQHKLNKTEILFNLRKESDL